MGKQFKTEDQLYGEAFREALRKVCAALKGVGGGSDPVSPADRGKVDALDMCLAAVLEIKTRYGA